MGGELYRSNFEAVLRCPEGVVRDHLWMWGHPAGSYDTARDKTQWPFTDYGFPKTSRMTPAEGALYLGIPNVIFVRYNGRPLPGGFERYAMTLSPFKRVVWSLNIAPRRKGPVHMRWTAVDEEEHETVRRLFEKYPNFAGVILDDYFKTTGREITSPGPGREISGPAAVMKLKETFGRAQFWDVMYTVDIEATDKEHLALMDVLTLWTRNDEDLLNLEESFAKADRLIPEKPRVLGCYMWDYLGDKRPIPLALMKHQCESALRWLKAGRIQGMIFCASSMCDMDIEAVEWVRRWIQNAGDAPI